MYKSVENIFQNAVVKATGLTALENVDFRKYSAELLFLPGVSSVTEKIEIIDDNTLEEDEEFLIELVEADGEIDDNNRDIIVTITDDDGMINFTDIAFTKTVVRYCDYTTALFRTFQEPFQVYYLCTKLVTVLL